MGYLKYDGDEIEIDDRTLAHLQIVIMQKLRHGESFAMSWAVAAELGSGRASIWLHPSIPIHFRFNGSRVPAINQEWLSELVASANGSRGLIVTPENAPTTGFSSVQTQPRQGGRRLEPAQMA